MALEDEIAGWEKNHPIEFGILRNAFSDAWIRSVIAPCIGASSLTKLHPLGRRLFFASNGNLTEVLLLAKFFSVFGADNKIGVLLDQLKNPDEYDTAFSHLATAYQFHRAGWKVNLEYDNRPNCVDLLISKGGELAYVECSQKILPLEKSMDDRTMINVLGRFTPSFGFHHAKLVFTGDGTEEELVKLIKNNAEAVREENDRIVIASENFRVEIVKNKSGKMESFVTIHDERPSKSLAERLLKKIMTEYKQTKSSVALRVVSLQVLGHPSPREWLAASKEIHTRLCGMQSRPDAVFIFQKRWSGEYFYWDEVGFWTTTEKRRIALESTSKFLLDNEKLE